MSAPDVILVGCSGSKLDHAAPARDLYTSPLFRAARAYAEAKGGPWAILSALHGLVLPDQILEPYDYTFEKRHGEGPRYRKSDLERWGNGVQRDLVRRWPEGRVVFLAGSSYFEAVRWLGDRRVCPLEGLGIGERLAWLRRETEALTTLGPEGWNRCPRCRELVDVPDPCFDGTEVTCCSVRLVVVEREDGSFSLEAEPDAERRECDFCGEERACAVSEQGHATPARPEVAAICGPCATWALDQLRAGAAS